MSASIAGSPPLARAAAEGDREATWWLVGGVAAELSDRLAASVGFIRTLLVVAMVLQPELLYAYALAALLVPHADRRVPSWSNLIGLGRFALFYLLIINLFGAGGSLTNNGGTVFGQGPAVWVPFAGATLFGFVALLESGRPGALRDAQRDRTVGLAMVAVLAGLGLVALGVVLVPSVQWQSAVGALAVLGGVGLVAGGRRTRGLLVPVVLLSVLAVLMASAGVRLQGGIGNEASVPLSASELHPAYRRAVGDLRLDLSALPPHASLLTVHASVGIGSLQIILPTGAQATVMVRIGRGAIETGFCSSRFSPQPFGIPHYAFDRAATVSSSAQRPACGGALPHPLLRLRILASVGIGTVRISEPPFQLGGIG